MLAEMARKKRDHDHSAFCPEDEIDELFGGANPNPERIGCPGGDVLRAAARKAVPMEHPVYDHLTECSECYREFRGFQSQPVRRRWPYAAGAIAAVLLLAVVGGPYAMRNLVDGAWSSGTQPIILDYQRESATRSEAGDPARTVNALTRRKVDATILTPTGSEPGKYEVRLVDSAGRVSFSAAAEGVMVDSAVRIQLYLDLRSAARGRYSLEIRRVGEDWDPHPLSIE